MSPVLATSPAQPIHQPVTSTTAMSAVTAATSAASAFSHKELPSREVSLTYYLNGKQQALCFKTEDPTFRELISILREQDRPFRIVYM